MPEVIDFKVSMRLVLEIGDITKAEDAARRLEEIWPETATTAWTDLPMAASSEPELRVLMNAEFVTNLGVHSPYPPAGTLLPPFQLAKWYVGAGGLHEGRDYVKHSVDGAPQFWTETIELDEPVPPGTPKKTISGRVLVATRIERGA